MNNLRHRLLTGPLRAWARRTGVTAVVSVPARWRSARRRFGFAWRRPPQAVVQAPGGSIRAWTGSAHEYARVVALVDDRHLLQALVARARVGGVFWDVGANLGLYSAVLARAVGASGHVLAFEPEPRVRARLHENLALNGAANVDVVPAALSNEEGVARLFVAARGEDGTHSVVADADRGAPSIDVPLRTGDGLIASGAPAPELLKIDVEGAEERVVEGLAHTLRSGIVRAVLIEMHFAILARMGAADAPARIAAALAACGLSRQTWLDRSHLLAERTS